MLAAVAPLSDLPSRKLPTIVDDWYIRIRPTCCSYRRAVVPFGGQLPRRRPDDVPPAAGKPSPPPPAIPLPHRRNYYYYSATILPPPLPHPSRSKLLDAIFRCTHFNLHPSPFPVKLTEAIRLSNLLLYNSLTIKCTHVSEYFHTWLSLFITI